MDLSDNDSLPPLTFDSSDDLNEDEDDDGDDDESLWSIDLPPLASFNESDTESDSEHDERCSLHDELCCSCDQQVPPLHCVSDESGCSGICLCLLYEPYIINNIIIKIINDFIYGVSTNYNDSSPVKSLPSPLLKLWSLATASATRT